MRRKQWVDALLGKRAEIERALGVPLGEMLGCGHWGCVLESEAPWVVKLSIDPTEGPIWQKIATLVREESWGERGFTEIRSITRLTPDLVVSGRKRKVWAIVREAVTPVFKEYALKELGERGRGTVIRTTKFTDDLLGFEKPQPFVATHIKQSTHEQEDFVDGVKGLCFYKLLSTYWHLLSSPRRTKFDREELKALMQRFPSVSTTEDLELKLGSTLNYFHGPHMGPLGESLNMLAVHSIYLRDVHQMNVGWHHSRGDDDWTHVVVFDPGHTPTEESEVETALIANGRGAL